MANAKLLLTALVILGAICSLNCQNSDSYVSANENKEEQISDKKMRENVDKLLNNQKEIEKLEAEVREKERKSKILNDDEDDVVAAVWDYDMPTETSSEELKYDDLILNSASGIFEDETSASNTNNASESDIVRQIREKRRASSDRFARGPLKAFRKSARPLNVRRAFLNQAVLQAILPQTSSNRLLGSSSAQSKWRLLLGDDDDDSGRKRRDTSSQAVEKVDDQSAIKLTNAKKSSDNLVPKKFQGGIGRTTQGSGLGRMARMGQSGRMSGMGVQGGRQVGRQRGMGQKGRMQGMGGNGMGLGAMGMGGKRNMGGMQNKAGNQQQRRGAQGLAKRPGMKQSTSATSSSMMQRRKVQRANMGTTNRAGFGKNGPFGAMQGNLRRM